MPAGAVSVDTQFGDYIVLQRLNRGATAVVYEAEEIAREVWQTSGPRVALKVFNERPGGGFTIPISTIQQEIKCASTLEHPNIAQLLNVVPCGNRLGLAFELVRGPDLLDYIKQYGSRVPEELAIHYFRQLLLAVQHMHKREVVHRDLKPENCMIDPETHTLKVIDFGLASSTDARCLTGCGTINTIAPECIAVDGMPTMVKRPQAVDIWGLGVTLFIMLSGTYPFQDLQRPYCDESHKRNILRGRIHALPSRTSAATKDLVRKILQVDPEHRLSVDQILAHAALDVDAPSERTFSHESQLFAGMYGMGSRVSSYASQSSDISPECVRPTHFPRPASQSSIDMDYESPASSSPASGKVQEASDPRTPSRAAGGEIASSLQNLPGFGSRASLFSSRESFSPWSSFGSLSASCLTPASQVDSLSNLASPAPSLTQTPNRSFRRLDHTGASSLTTSKSGASLSSQLDIIQAALQEESERAVNEASEAARLRSFEESDADEIDTEFGSEFDGGDKAKIWSTRSPASLAISCTPSHSSSVTPVEELSRSMDSSCSLPWSPKDAAERPNPVKLFSVTSAEAPSSDAANSSLDGPSSSQGPSSGQGQGRLKAVPSFQQLSPFKSYLSDIPEEADGMLDEEGEEGAADCQDLGGISLSLQSDATTYDMV